MDLSREEAAEARVRAALRDIQEAQSLIGRASQALSSVVGMVPEWNRLGRVYNQVRGAWYAVESKGQRLRGRRALRIDHEPNHHEAEWADHQEPLS
jgi:hypothetical protein